MSRPNMIELLNICMQRVQAGSTVEEAIAPYPEQKEDLRILLLIALDALPSSRDTLVSAGAQVNSRRRFLARAQQLQEQPGSAGLWKLFNIARAHAGSLVFAVSAVFLLFLALTSLQALPGDGLYPVKLAAEQAGVNLSPSSTERAQRESAFDSRRAEEVARMIQLNRTGSVDFGGFLAQSENGRWDVASIPLQDSPILPAQTRGLSGVYVEVKGELTAQGEVQAKALQPRLDPLAGIIEQVREDGWQVDGQWVSINEASRVTGSPRVGSSATIQAAHLAGGAGRLVIYAEVTGGIEPSTTPEPTATAQPSPTQTPTRAPTLSPTVTITNTPALILATPAAHETDDSGDHEDESGDDHDSNSDSGSDHDSKDDDSDQSDKDH